MGEVSWSPNCSGVDPSVRAGLAASAAADHGVAAASGGNPGLLVGLPFEEKGPGTELPHLTGMSELRPFAQWYAEARLAEDPRAFTEAEMAIITAGTLQAR